MRHKANAGKEERLRRLARQIEALAQKDERLLEKARDIAALRRRAACELHAVCAGFVRSLNGLLPQAVLELAPPEFPPETFRDPGMNLIQINAQGRIVQIAFESTPELVSTEHFKTPYVLEGEVRAYNQEMLERIETENQLLFFCLEKEGNVWRVFDRRAYHTSLFNEEYLVGLMERLV